MASALLGAGKVCTVSSAFEEALPLLEQSIALWRVLDDKPRLAESLHYVALSLMGLGQAEAVCGLFEANESVFREFADPSVLAFALTLWGRALMNARGDFAAAKALHEESLAVGRRLKHPQALGTTYWGLGFWAMQQGDYEAARRYQLESLAWRRQTASGGYISVSLLSVADVVGLQGDYLQARPLYEEALALNRGIGDQLRVAHVFVRLGYLVLHQGDKAQAAACFAESLETCRERANQVGIARCLAGYAELRRVQGRVAQAVCLLASDALLPVMRDERGPVDRIEYERSVTVARSQLDEATFKAAWAKGRALTLEQAIAEAQQVTASEAPILPTLTAPLTSPASLTAREVEVLRLLAIGLTNLEIADQLVLSRRTIHAHLRSIYSKLDVTTRNAATRAALELKLV